jgi:prevent-host-death family protein
MATVISKEELDAHASDVIDRAWAGEEIVIEERGAPKLRLIPVAPPVSVKRQPGTLKGRIGLSLDQALEPLSEDELRLWQGG